MCTTVYRVCVASSSSTNTSDCTTIISKLKHMDPFAGSELAVSASQSKYFALGLPVPRGCGTYDVGVSYIFLTKSEFY